MFLYGQPAEVETVAASDKNLYKSFTYSKHFLSIFTQPNTIKDD